MAWWFSEIQSNKKKKKWTLRSFCVRFGKTWQIELFNIDISRTSISLQSIVGTDDAWVSFTLFHYLFCYGSPNVHCADIMNGLLASCWCSNDYTQKQIRFRTHTKQMLELLNWIFGEEKNANYFDLILLETGGTHISGIVILVQHQYFHELR